MINPEGGLQLTADSNSQGKEKVERKYMYIELGPGTGWKVETTLVILKHHGVSSVEC